MVSPTRRFGLASGVLAPVVAFGAILVATFRSPIFEWATSDLSVVGVLPATDLLFNGGLIIGGLLALPFAATLASDGRWTVALAFALSVVSMALVGVFPAGTSVHFSVAIAFYLLLTVTMALDSLEAFRVGVRERGIVAVALALAHLGSWSLWMSGIRVGDGLAIPDAIGAALFQSGYERKFGGFDPRRTRRNTLKMLPHWWKFCLLSTVAENSQQITIVSVFGVASRCCSSGIDEYRTRRAKRRILPQVGQQATAPSVFPPPEARGVLRTDEHRHIYDPPL